MFLFLCPVNSFCISRARVFIMASPASLPEEKVIPFAPVPLTLASVILAPDFCKPVVFGQRS